MIHLKRAYEAAEESDGERYLVDRLWPRGVTKEAADLTGWLRDVAPSQELRKWFGHEPAKWIEFQRRYERELQAPERAPALATLVARARQGTITLVYGARDTEHNAAVVLKRVLERGPKRS